MVRNIEIGPEVEAIIGSDQARSFRQGPFPDDFTCAACGEEGFASTGIPLTISATQHPDNQTRLLFRHERCGPSEVRRDNRPIDGLVGDVAKFTPILRRDIEPLAAGIFSPSFMVTGGVGPLSDKTSLFTAKLLEDGFEPVLGNPIENFNGGDPVRGWKLKCSTSDLVIQDSDGSTVYDGTVPDEMPAWVDALATQRRFLLIAGDGIELDTDPMKGLAAAVWEGRVAAGIIAAEVNRAPASLPPKRAERRAAERAVRKRRSR